MRIELTDAQEQLRQDAIAEMMRIHHQRKQNFIKEIEDYLASDQCREAKERARANYRNVMGLDEIEAADHHEDWWSNSNHGGQS